MDAAGGVFMADQRVTLISTSTIRAASHNHIERIELTPWDLQFLLLGSIQKGLLFPKPKFQSQNEEEEEEEEELNLENTLAIINHLKKSLSLTLDFFSPLAGRLATSKHDGDGDTCSFYITCNNAGVEFVHAVADGVTVSDVLDPVYIPRIVHSFFTLNGIRNLEGVSKPLLAVQVTELVDGIFIGCTLNHVVGDGTCFWHFFNSWSEISRGNNNSDCISNLPFLTRWFLDGIDIPIWFHLPRQIEKQRIDPPPSLEERVFHFTKEKMAALKERANAERIGGRTISSLQALLAHLWRSVIRNRSSFEPDQEIQFYLLVGARPRMQNPSLPKNYFGNAIVQRTVTMKAGEVIENGLGYVAMKFNEMVVSQTEESMKEDFKSWIKNPKIFILGSLTNALATSSSPRFNVYGPNFGWGKPVAVRSGGGNKFDGKITLFPGKEEGSVDIEACFLVETLVALGNDRDFMEV